MPTWIIAVALASVVLTAALTWVLWRINMPQKECRANHDDGSVVAPAAADDADSKRDDGLADDGASGDGADGGGGD
jgi:type VI protein secretion system component VasK